ncbi:MAG TPA: DUF1330 domain-containing protein [Candidatus Sumerlaeota bacterium]|nr:DUF1330 domain-containing protein [Candidatus Sumerlaeota bacterium]HPS01593.1 DUF1330 domain-containing protein [Candidatus Sumerlaeota bacterium]
MKYYFAGSLKINDPDRYREYQQAVAGMAQKYGGVFLSKDEAPRVVEGAWNYSKFVLIEFPSRADFEKWYFSKEYQEAVKLRWAATKSDVILAEGIQ